MTVPHFTADMTAADMLQRIGRDDPVILECGCHDGRDTKKFLEAFPKCHVVCFEPDPRPIERHDPPGFLDRIGNDPRVRLIRAAVAEENGWRLMYRSSGTPPGENPETHDYDHSGSICRPTGHLAYSSWVKFPESHHLPVPTITLDTFLSFYPRIAERGIDLIWVDVQGAEGLLIQGAQKTLQNTRYFYTEWYEEAMYEGEPPLDKICDMLPDFKLDSTWCDNALFQRKDTA